MSEPYIDSDGRFVYDTLSKGVWYVMRPKSILGARAIPNAIKLINNFNEELKKEYSKYLNFSQSISPSNPAQPLTMPLASNQASASNLAQQLTQPQAPTPAPAQSSAALRNEVYRSAAFRNEASHDASPPDFITVYAPRYRKEISVGVFRERFVFHNYIFVHTTPSVMAQFMKDKPYQIFFIPDYTRNPDTNQDEYGNPTYDNHMRISSSVLATLFLSLQEYTEDVRIFTAHELQELKYTRQVLIVDGPLKGRVCRIKSIQGKQRIIVDLLEGSLSLVLVMSDTHFQRIKA